MRALILLLVSTHLFYTSQCTECTTFKKVKLTAIPVKGEQFNVTINGCIDSQTFNGRAVKGLYVKQQIMRYLNSDSIKDLDQLEAVSFDECVVHKVEPGAFRNVPKLAEIFLVNSYLKEIPRNVFNHLYLLQKIRLHNNSIRMIEKGAFGNLLFLRKLYLSHNRLEHWDGDWLSNSLSVEKLDLEFNMIRKIPEGAFRNLPNLKKINFNFNNISVIEKNAFEGLGQLKYLGLRHNRLSEIGPEIFPDLMHVGSLFIDANRLNYLPSPTMTKLSVENVTLDGNPWNCPCLENIAAWLRLTNGKAKTSKYCKGSNMHQCMNLHYNCTEAVDTEVTTMYLNLARYKQQRKKLNDYCVRLD